MRIQYTLRICSSDICRNDALYVDVGIECCVRIQINIINSTFMLTNNSCDAGIVSRAEVQATLAEYWTWMITSSPILTAAWATSTALLLVVVSIVLQDSDDS
jgi:hypothetical protein